MSAIDELLTQSQRDLAAREVRIVAQLLQSYGVALRRIERELRTIEAQIAEAIASGQDVNETWITRQRWWRQVEASIQREMARWADDAARGIAILQDSGAMLAVDVSSEIARLAGSPLQGRVYAQAFERWVSAIQPGSPVLQVINSYDAKVRSSVIQRMTEGIGGGKAPRSIVREIMRDVDGIADESRIMTLARTESMRAYRGASADTMGQLQERGIVSGYVWLAALGPRCCPACVARHGTFYEVAPNDFHPNCRCRLRPVADPRLVPGGGWKGQTGPDWLADQDEDLQRRILITDGRYDAYKAGTPMSEMVTVRQSEIWGPTMGVKAVRDLPKTPKQPRTKSISTPSRPTRVQQSGPVPGYAIPRAGD